MATRLDNIVSNCEGAIGRIKDKIGNLNRINQIIRAILPKAIQLEVTAGAFKQNSLILYAATPAIATKLQYEKQSLLQTLRKEGFYQLSNIDIKLNPDLKAPLPAKKKPRMATSRANAKLISETASNIKNEQLKQALKKLSRSLNE